MYYDKPDANGHRVPIYCVHHERKQKNLGLYLYTTPKSQSEKIKNEETLRLAEELQDQAENEFLKNRRGYGLNLNHDVNFMGFYQEYIDSYKKEDKRNVEQSQKRFQNYLRQEYPSLVTTNKNHTKSGDEITYTYRVKPERLNRDIG
jgi:hypothetical protein